MLLYITVHVAIKVPRDFRLEAKILAEDMGLELRRLLAQTVEMKGGLSLYSDGM